MNNERVTCKACKRKFPTQKGLSLHVERSRSCPIPPSYKCDLCSKEFKWKWNLMKHLQAGSEDLCSSLSCVRAQPNVHSKYQCDACEGRFVTKRGLMVHISTHHQRCKLHACGVCGTKFGHAVYLAMHTRTMHGKSQPQCDECNAKFRQKTVLTKHIKRVHMHLHTTYKYDQCSSSFTKSSHLTTHKKAIHKVTVFVECDDCGAKLANRRNLELHILGVHMKLNQFKCDKCPAAFSYSTQLCGHKRALHETKFLTCDECGKTAETKFSLAKHCFSFHMGLRLRPRKYKICSFCGETFHNSNLARHKKRIHFTVR